jgi:hypothetical protein
VPVSGANITLRRRVRRRHDILQLHPTADGLSRLVPVVLGHAGRLLAQGG